eukprot:TRINITY_DN20560_c0_g1_i1.p1 TRINITY_DN20560_c0_g1~~TRINITY_DN20560_c0_g1_i1.p1  ORF type:complete len:386 (+),score=94.55 TRINITY_DN20560_c0_g1_i1:132-1160(+)
MDEDELWTLSKTLEATKPYEKEKEKNREEKEKVKEEGGKEYRRDSIFAGLTWEENAIIKKGRTFGLKRKYERQSHVDLEPSNEITATIRQLDGNLAKTINSLSQTQGADLETLQVLSNHFTLMRQTVEQSFDHLYNRILEQDQQIQTLSHDVTELKQLLQQIQQTEKPSFNPSNNGSSSVSSSKNNNSHTNSGGGESNSSGNTNSSINNSKGMNSNSMNNNSMNDNSMNGNSMNSMNSNSMKSNSDNYIRKSNSTNSIIKSNNINKSNHNIEHERVNSNRTLFLNSHKSTFQNDNCEDDVSDNYLSYDPHNPNQDHCDPDSHGSHLPKNNTRLDENVEINDC